MENTPVPELPTIIAAGIQCNPPALDQRDLYACTVPGLGPVVFIQ